MSDPTKTSKTAEELRADAERLEREAVESFERCDTDGFVSQWASGIMAQLRRSEAGLVEAGNVSTFPALYDLETGSRVPAKLIDGRYGLSWALVEPGTDRFTGTFVGAFPARTSTMARKGYREGLELAPARAKIVSHGHGLAGAASATVQTVRTDDGTGQDPAVVPVEDDDEVFGVSDPAIVRRAEVVAAEADVDPGFVLHVLEVGPSSGREESLVQRFFLTPDPAEDVVAALAEALEDPDGRGEEISELERIIAEETLEVPVLSPEEVEARVERELAEPVTAEGLELARRELLLGPDADRCSGTVYAVDDAPASSAVLDVHHDGPCPVHDETEEV